MLFKIGTLKNFVNFTAIYLCESLFEERCKPSGDLIIKRLQHKWFPTRFAKFLRAPCFTDHLWLLLFKISNSNNLFKDFSAIHA